MPGSKTIPGFHAVLLAGGSGTRFWPSSRKKRPKQFLALAGEEPLLRSAWGRARSLAPPSRIWVVAPASMADDVASMLRGLRPDRLVREPSPRDTAPAVTLASRTVEREAPGAVLGVFPTDHVIRDVAAFREAVGEAVRAARDGSLVCLGIKPARPATGFGYLQCARAPATGSAAAVTRFVEKPPVEAARRYLRSGRYLWNAGMFVWRADRFREEVSRTAPAILRAIDGHLAGRSGSWVRATRMSVDYAVMEKARRVAVVPLDAGWDDVGSWDVAARLREGSGREHVLVDSDGAAVFADERTVAVVGVPGVIVVDSADAVLVVARDRAEDVKKVVRELERRGRKDLL